MSNVAIFDLDHTITSVDCSSECIKYLHKHKFISAPNKNFMITKSAYDRSYYAGDVNMLEFSRLVLKPLTGLLESALQQILKRFSKLIIDHFIYPKAYETINNHLRSGDQILLISASLIDLVRPIGKLLGFDYKNIIGLSLNKEQGRITNKIIEPISFGEGKIYHYKKWENEYKIRKCQKVIFYSDSINDLPLLNFVNKPICVNPDPKLMLIANKNKWEIRAW